MKGVVLAGGTGSRLKPLTNVINKHLLPVYNKPMIYYPIEFLRDSGITDILVILGGNSVGDFVNLLGNGEELGVSLTYRYQSKPDGIAGALKLAKEFVRDEPFTVCLGDNVFGKPISNIVWVYQPYLLHTNRPGAMVFLSHTEKPSSFGVPTFGPDGFIRKITEKPKEPDSNYAVTGLYCYDKNIWSMIDSLEPSARGELEITDINNWYIENGQLYQYFLESWWYDCGSIEALSTTWKLVEDSLNAAK